MSNAWSKYGTDGLSICFLRPPQSTTLIRIQIFGTNYDQFQPMGRDKVVAPLVIQSPLFPAIDATDCFAFVKKGDRFVVLAFAVFNDDAKTLVVAIDG